MRKIKGRTYILVATCSGKQFKIYKYGKYSRK